MRNIRAINNILLSLGVSALLLTVSSCQKDEVTGGEVAGGQIRFGASIGSSPVTKTEYTGENVNSGSLGSGTREIIDWVTGDKIDIFAFPGSGSSHTFDRSADYTVAKAERDGYKDYGTLTAGANPLMWDQEDYRFLAFYPAGTVTEAKATKGSNGIFSTLSMSLPASQNYPVNMDYAYMYADTKDVAQNDIRHSADQTVSLDFFPMITTLQFEIVTSITDKAVTINSMRLESVATTKQALCGDYTYNLNDDLTKGYATPVNSESESAITVDMNSTAISTDSKSPTVVDFFLIPQSYKGEELKLTIETNVGSYTNILKVKSGKLDKIEPNYKYDIAIVLNEKGISLTTAGKELLFYTVVQSCRDYIINQVFNGKTTPSGDNELYGVKLSAITNHCGDSDYSNFFNDLLNNYVKRDDLKNNTEAKEAFLSDFLKLFEEEMEEILDAISKIESVTLKFGGSQGISLNLDNGELSLFKSLTTLNIDVNDNLAVSISMEDMPFLKDVSTQHGVTYSFKNCPNLEKINLQNFQNANEYNVVIDNCPKFTALNSSNFNITSQLEKTNITILNMPELKSVEIGQSDGPKSLTISDCAELTTLTLGDNNKKTGSLALTNLPLFKSGTVTRNLDDNKFLLTISNVSNGLASGEKATLAISGSGSPATESTKNNSPNLTVTANGTSVLD